MGIFFKKKAFFSIKDKIKIIKHIKNGTNQLAICEKFFLSKSTVSSIWKKCSLTFLHPEINLDSSKYLCWTKRENVEETVLKCFTT